MTAPEFNTPMMQQYLSLKKKYSDCILFFRLGDFYEMFMEDAKLGAQILDITLTSRDRGKDGRIPMCGVPYHAVDAYLAKLVKAGYKVAICEQISGPKKNDTASSKLFEREVVRIVTPGTLLTENSLDKKENNYILTIYIEKNVSAVALVDLSTGEFLCSEFNKDKLHDTIVNGLAKFNVVECILPSDLYNDPKILGYLKSHRHINIFPFFEFSDHKGNVQHVLKEHFGVKNLETFAFGSTKAAQIAAVALLGYLKSTQKSLLPHIKNIKHLANSEFVALDRATINNLELFSTLRDGNKKSSLINFLDRTLTASGGRMLKSWLSRPLLSQEAIERRLNVVDFFINNFDMRDKTRGHLAQVSDIERILSRLSVGIGSPRDLNTLKDSLKEVRALINLLANQNVLTSTLNLLNIKTLDLSDYLEKYLLDDVPLDPKKGGFIANGVNKDLDKLRNKVVASKDYLAKLEISERQNSKINSLKVKYNQVFGYYIEISKSNLGSVPSHYLRKQTLVNAERFITPELKEHEEIILTAEEKTSQIEYEIFLSIVDHILGFSEQLQQVVSVVSTLDCLVSFAVISEESNFVCPVLTNDKTIKIRGGWHPVVALNLPRGEFIPNDTTMDSSHNQLAIITGPNMGGKSVYLRQTALIVLLAQTGCFVPAEEASISICDKIFVRSGASDAIAGGLSTFMVEMVETAYILNNVSDDSLIIMDEIGRWTSTFDGIALAWAIAHYLVTHESIRPKTLFATHYHELQKLAEEHPDRIKNLQAAVDNDDGIPVFLHKIIPGAAEHSFGIQVAKMAGVVEDVCLQAENIMKTLIKRSVDVDSSRLEAIPLPKLFELQHLDVLERLRHIDISRTTPLEALNILSELKQSWDV